MSGGIWPPRDPAPEPQGWADLAMDIVVMLVIVGVILSAMWQAVAP